MKRLLAIALAATLCMRGLLAAGLSEHAIQTQSDHNAASSHCGDRSVILIVDPALEAAIRAPLDQFHSDLCAGGYNVIETSEAFANPTAVREYLHDQYNQPESGLAGAILIGEIPYAYQWFFVTHANPSIPDYEEEVISFQYFSDLDGDFSRSAGYVSPGGHEYSFDVHEGAIDWEIWIGVLPLYKGSLGSTINALERYFAKNHAYRTGALSHPNTFLQISELLDKVEYLREGPYTWSPYSDEADARLYPSGEVSDGYTDLSEGSSDITVVDAHGYWGASGQLSILDVETTPVKTLLFWSNGCSIGNLDYADNFLTSVLYSPTSDVVIAKGTTNDSGGMGTNEDGFFGRNIATALAAGASLGDAILSHVNVPLLYPWSDSRELHYATPVILGDPTLPRILSEGINMNAGLNGNWWNGLARNGEGAQIEVADAGDGGLLLVVTIYSYDSLGNQIFLVAVGPVSGSTAEVDVFITEGGTWGEAFDPAAVNETQWGTGMFMANSCGSISMALMPNAEFQGKGYSDLEYDLVRLTTPVLPCPLAGPD